MADRALSEAELKGLRISFDDAVGDERFIGHCRRLLAEHAALREVARAVDHARNLAVQDFGEQQKADRAVDDALADLEAAHPGVLEKEDQK